MKYLIRLFEKQDYAEQFLAGQLRLLPAGYYIKMESDELGRTDSLEGAVSKKERINIAFPILCLVECEAVQHDENYALVLGTNIVRDFCKNGGYAVAIEEDRFIQLISPLVKTYSIESQPSYYGNVIYDLTESKLPDHWEHPASSEINLLHKRTNYSYQHEYRFVFTNPSHYTFCINDGFNQPWRVNMADLHDSAYIFRIKPLCENKEDYVTLPLRESHSAAKGSWKC